MLLAIESSCDESGLSLFDPVQGVVGAWVHSQVALHSGYGGVVPSLASREHLRNFPELLRHFPDDFSPAEIDFIAVTRGPGLAACLALGLALAKALALAWDKPLVGVNHLRGHLFSPFVGLHADSPSAFRESFEDLLPHLGLVVSGGNTLLVSLDRGGRTSVIAQTVDDAAGEAFDKGAKLLGLPYPGGALIEKLACGGDPSRFDFPQGIASKTDLRFSFSGLKTSLRHKLEQLDDDLLTRHMSDICAGYQAAIVAQLMAKTEAALATRQFASVGLSGGVANNGSLRAAFAKLAARRGLPLRIAEPRYSGDNAAMIAFAAFADESLPSPVRANWSLAPAPALTIDA
ncbi:MAG: tRNA (adenosine(37)-N6)-threonylcarbamoyltransferase complex transferase subunit TsaD [Puniceicoccales bacterium]|jgi:N6-L-threonylcarbamoyladenine synthase|nr:tRNA (adenosine(37)-N6)-threonylcarbamoyltransferase complex transferase subunit TsaD [Puniceicoccales bacterium]